MIMKKIVLYFLLLCIACQSEKMELNLPDGESSTVNIELSSIEAVYENIISRGVDDVQGETVQELLYSLHYVLADADGNILEQTLLTEEELTNFQSLELSLKKGEYKLFVLGEGKNFSFSHVTEEVHEVNSITDIWFHNIRYQPVRRELFYASLPFTIDGIGTNVDLQIELRRQVGMLDIEFETSHSAEEISLLGLIMLVPDAYLANYMTVDGKIGFDMSDTNGTGYYWTYDAVITENKSRFFMLPSLPFQGNEKPKLVFSYGIQENDNFKIINKEIVLEDLKIEANRVTTVTITID